MVLQWSSVLFVVCLGVRMGSHVHDKTVLLLCKRSCP